MPLPLRLRIRTTHPLRHRRPSCQTLSSSFSKVPPTYPRKQTLFGTTFLHRLSSVPSPLLTDISVFQINLKDMSLIRQACLRKITHPYRTPLWSGTLPCTTSPYDASLKLHNKTRFLNYNTDFPRQHPRQAPRRPGMVNRPSRHIVTTHLTTTTTTRTSALTSVARPNISQSMEILISL